MDESDRISAVFLVVAAAGLLTATGCISSTTGHTATPVEEGSTELVGRAGYWGLTATAPRDQGLRGNLPNAELAGRFGLSDSVGLGFKVFPIGVGADLNIAAVNTDTFALSLNPSIGFVGVPALRVPDTSGTAGGGSYGTALVNVLADVYKTDIVTLTTGLKPGLFYAFGSVTDTFRANARFAMGGTLLGRVDVNDNLAITPSIDVIAPVGIDEGSVVFYTGMIGANLKL